MYIVHVSIYVNFACIVSFYAHRACIHLFTCAMCIVHVSIYVHFTCINLLHCTCIPFLHCNCTCIDLCMFMCTLHKYAFMYVPVYIAQVCLYVCFREYFVPDQVCIYICVCVHWTCVSNYMYFMRKLRTCIHLFSACFVHVWSRAHCTCTIYVSSREHCTCTMNMYPFNNFICIHQYICVHVQFTLRMSHKKSAISGVWCKIELFVCNSPVWYFFVF